jgi:hypothetical protein
VLLFARGDLLADHRRRLQVGRELDTLEMGWLLRFTDRPGMTTLVASAFTPGAVASQPLADPARTHGVSVRRKAAQSAE